MPHHSGDVLGGRYRLDDRIAAGGMGEVWRATDTVLHRDVALKTLRAERAIDPPFRSRFQHEAQAMATLHHPGIPDVYDFGEEPGDDAYLVMARVAGQPLNRRIAELGRLTVAETMSIVAQVGRALQAAHDAGIVHRDVKPGNILRQPDGTAVLVDFGIARSARSAMLTGADEVVGTAGYIAPEQLSKRPVGPATDVYGLGAVAYHCLAGHPPFLGRSPVLVAVQHLREEPPPLPGDMPSSVRALVAVALAKDPAARFSSAAAMAAAAERLTTAAAVTTNLGVRPGHAPPSPGRTRPRHRVAVLLLVLLTLLGAGIALALAHPFEVAPVAPAPAATTTSRRSTAPPAHRIGGRTSGPSLSTSRSPSPAPSTQPSTPPTTTKLEQTPTPTGPLATDPLTGSTGSTDLSFI